MKFQENIQNRLTARHKKSFDLVGNVKNKIILDIGCSFGWFEKFAVESGCKEITGTDIDEKNLLNAKNLVKDKRVQFTKTSIFDISTFRGNYFDLIVMWEVLEHLPKDTEKKVFQEINRVLKHGGRLYISIPNKTFWSCILDPAWYFGHRHYSKKKMITYLSEAGFKSNDVSYGGGFYEQFSMILLYFFKWIFRKEIPFKEWFDKKRNKEYSNGTGFVTLFVKSDKEW